MPEIPEAVKNQLLEDYLSFIPPPPPTATGFSPYRRPDEDLLRRELASQSFALLVEILSEDPEIKLKLNQKRCDLYDIPLADGESGLYSFFLKMHEKDIGSFEQCKKELKSAINDLSKISAKSYQFIIALNFQSDNEIDSEIDGQSFQLLPSSEGSDILAYLDSNLNSEEEDQQNEEPGSDESLLKYINKSFDPSHSYFLADVHARSSLFADHYIKEKVLYFLGLLQLSKRITSYLVPPGREKSLLAVQYDIIVSEDGFGWHPYLYSKRDLEYFNDEELQTFAHYLDVCKKIRSHAPGVAGVVFKALKSFYEASTEPDIAHSFLKYWICVEFCFLKSTSVSEKEIANRLKRVVLHDDPHIDWKIDFYVGKRNELVHQLKMDIASAQRDHVGLFAQRSIKWLLDNGAKFSNVNELELFFRYMQENQSSLEVDKKIINKAIKMRQDRTPET